MSIPAPQAEAAAALREMVGAAPVETHVSAVYIGRDAALKLKKAVALGFLDFTMLAERERLLRRELALNQPFAPGLYRDVVPLIRAADGRLRLGFDEKGPDEAGPDEAGPPVEWVLRMAPVAPADFLDAAAAADGLDAARLDALADAVAAMHAALPPAAAVPDFAAVLAGNARAALAAGL
ncbi:MAG: hypothetical protein JWP04_2548, partial [Belnapia sp.]|nr:hypothetical protein [Belnapia sp.]